MLNGIKRFITSTFPYYVSLGLNLSAQEQSRLSMLHLVGGVARVGRAEGVEEEVIERKRKKKMRLNKICADSKVTIFSGKKTKKLFCQKGKTRIHFFG